MLRAGRGLALQERRALGLTLEVAFEAQPAEAKAAVLDRFGGRVIMAFQGSPLVAAVDLYEMAGMLGVPKATVDRHLREPDSGQGVHGVGGVG